MFLKDYDRRFTFGIANYVKNSIISIASYQLVIILCVSYVVNFLFVLNYTQRVVIILYKPSTPPVFRASSIKQTDTVCSYFTT